MYARKKQIFQMKIILPEKTDNFLYLSEKLFSYTFMEKSRHFILDMF